MTEFVDILLIYGRIAKVVYSMAKGTTGGKPKIERGVLFCDEFWDIKPRNKSTTKHPANVFKKRKHFWTFLGITHADEVSDFGIKTEVLDKDPNPNSKTDKTHPSCVTVRPMVADKCEFSNKRADWGYQTHADKKMTDYFKKQPVYRKKKMKKDGN
jgi:hypothetical protein